MDKNDVMKYIVIGVSAILCGLTIYYTKGLHGIGWFILALMIIW